MLNTIFIYLFFLNFWLFHVLNINLHFARGISSTHLCFYILLFSWTIKAMRTKKLVESNNLNKPFLFMAFIILASVLIKMLLREIPHSGLASEIVLAIRSVYPLVMFFIILNVINDKLTCYRTILGLYLLMAIMALCMALDLMNIVDFGSIEVDKYGRAATFVEPNQFAAYLVVFLPLHFLFVIHHKGFFVKIVNTFLFVIVLICLIGTGSRGGILAFLVGMVFFFSVYVRYKKVKFIKTLGLATLMMLICITSYIISPSTTKQTLKERTAISQSKGVAEYTTGRSIIWKNGLKLFLSSPIFGHGKDSFRPLMLKRFKLKAHSHNDYLLYVVDYGLIGLFIFVIILIRIYSYVWQNIKLTKDNFNKGLYLCYLSGFVGYVVAILNVNVMTAPQYLFWCYTAAVYKYAILETKKMKTYETD